MSAPYEAAVHRLARQVLDCGAVDTQAEAEALVAACAEQYAGLPWCDETRERLVFSVRLAILRSAGMEADSKMTVGQALARLATRQRMRGRA
jgi:hypothetical protein